MYRNCFIIATFLARMIVATFDLGSPDLTTDALKPNDLRDIRPAAMAPPADGVPSPTIVSGLPMDAGTLRR